MVTPEAGTYEAEVDDYTAVTDDWKLSTAFYEIKRETSTGTKEAYTLTCEDGQGTVLESRDLVIDRGQTVALNLCGATGPLGNEATTTPSTAPSKAKAKAKKKASSKKAKARARCRAKAKRIKSRSKRNAALRRCDKPAKAKKHAKKKKRR